MMESNEYRPVLDAEAMSIAFEMESPVVFAEA